MIKSNSVIRNSRDSNDHILINCEFLIKVCCFYVKFNNTFSIIFVSPKSHFCYKNYINISTLFVITVIPDHFVRFKHEIIHMKNAEPNLPTYFVRYNRDRCNQIRLYLHLANCDNINGVITVTDNFY